jgi:hypothetical protein
MILLKSEGRPEMVDQKELAVIIASTPAEGAVREMAVIGEVDRNDDALLGTLFKQVAGGLLSVEAYETIYERTDKHGKFVDDAWRLIAIRTIRYGL